MTKVMRTSLKSSCPTGVTQIFLQILYLTNDYYMTLVVWLSSLNLRIILPVLEARLIKRGRLCNDI